MESLQGLELKLEDLEMKLAEKKKNMANYRACENFEQDNKVYIRYERRRQERYFHSGPYPNKERVKLFGSVVDYEEDNVLGKNKYLVKLDKDSQ